MSLRRLERHFDAIQRRLRDHQEAVPNPWVYRPGDPVIEAWVLLRTEHQRLALRLHHAEQRAQWRQYVGETICELCGGRVALVAEAIDWVEDENGPEVTGYGPGAGLCCRRIYTSDGMVVLLDERDPED